MEQELLQNDISRSNWVYARNTVIRFLIAFDENEEELFTQGVRHWTGADPRWMSPS
ncbi:hypothetical protein ACP8HI_04815 [Paenibacillus sp. FA6]|uniref:hypothetical protein n=1 Tax=Paenibacillus sp. FA6 TaxID=3413029 RepID=UPI003F655127